MVMKKIFYCYILICILITSCAKKGSVMGTFTDDDMVLVLDGNTYYFGDDASKLLDFLGEPQEVTEILSCYHEGYDKTYIYDKVEVTTFPKDGKDILDEVIFYSDTYSFKGGVTVGSSKDDIIKAYGDKYFVEDDAMLYNKTSDNSDKQSPRLTFILKNDKVIAIDFFSNSYFS